MNGIPFRRFHVSVHGPALTHAELSEALTGKLALDGVKIDPMWSKTDSIAEATFEVPESEAEFLRVSMKAPTVYIDRLCGTIRLEFQEVLHQYVNQPASVVSLDRMRKSNASERHSNVYAGLAATNLYGRHGQATPTAFQPQSIPGTSQQLPGTEQRLSIASRPSIAPDMAYCNCTQIMKADEGTLFRDCTSCCLL